MPNAVLAQLIGRTLSQKYAIQALIGSGGMGAVFRARQIALDKLVAVKVLHRELATEPKFVERFRREALSASRLDHPNSLRVLDFGDDDGVVFLVMEYLPAEDLLTVMNREWPLDDARVVRILSQTLGALAAAHDLGIVHRDLKPENILVLRCADDDGAPSEIVKVCDFGVAKLLLRTEQGSERFARSLTTEGIAIGTPDYMSPEQARGDDVDGRSDLYSLGVVLYHLITGRTPFIGEGALAVALQHVTDDPPPPSRFREVHPELEAICLRALSKRPDDRFQSAREMRRALRAALGEPVTSSNSTPPFVLTHPIRTPSFVTSGVELGHSSSVRKGRRRRSSSPLRQTATAATGGILLAATIAGSVPAARRELERRVRAQWNTVEAVVAHRLETLDPGIAQISADPTPMADFVAPSRPPSSTDGDGNADAVADVCAAPVAPPCSSAPGAAASGAKAQSPSTMSERPRRDAPLVSGAAAPRVSSSGLPSASQATSGNRGIAADSTALAATTAAGASTPGRPQIAATGATPTSTSPILQPPFLQPLPSQPLQSPPPTRPPLVTPTPPRSSDPRQGADLLPFDASRASVEIASISTSAGVLANKVRAALSRIPLALCYRQALREHNAPIPLKAALRIAVDSSGRVVTSTLSRDANLPGLRTCVESQVRTAQLIDTADGNVTVDLTFSSQ